MGKKAVNPDRTNHKIPLPRQAVEMLKKLPRISQYVFSSLSVNYRGAKVKTIHIPRETVWAQVRKFDTTLHGFRNLIASILADKGFSTDAIHIQLGHKRRGLDAVYLRNSQMYEQRKEMLQYWADYMEALIEDKVIKLEKVA